MAKLEKKCYQMATSQIIDSNWNHGRTLALNRTLIVWGEFFFVLVRSKQLVVDWLPHDCDVLGSHPAPKKRTSHSVSLRGDIRKKLTNKGKGFI